jgi:hypothetical protein
VSQSPHQPVARSRFGSEILALAALPRHKGQPAFHKHGGQCSLQADSSKGNLAGVKLRVTLAQRNFARSPSHRRYHCAPRTC